MTDYKQFVAHTMYQCSVICAFLSVFLFSAVFSSQMDGDKADDNKNVSGAGIIRHRELDYRLLSPYYACKNKGKYDLREAKSEDPLAGHRDLMKWNPHIAAEYLHEALAFKDKEAIGFYVQYADNVCCVANDILKTLDPSLYKIFIAVLPYRSSATINNRHELPCSDRSGLGAIIERLDDACAIEFTQAMQLFYTQKKPCAHRCTLRCDKRRSLFFQYGLTKSIEKLMSSNRMSLCEDLIKQYQPLISLQMIEYAKKMKNKGFVHELENERKKVLQDKVGGSIYADMVRFGCLRQSGYFDGIATPVLKGKIQCRFGLSIPLCPKE